MTISTPAANLPPFHLAFPVNSLAASRQFYGGLMGCPEGRSSDEWIDFNFFGHQIVCHLVPERGAKTTKADADPTNAVDGHDVPVPHFGAVLPIAQWQALADKLTAAGTDFIIKPYIRFKGEVGEQATMFLLDPSGNALEFKSFADLDSLFAK